MKDKDKPTFTVVRHALGHWEVKFTNLCGEGEVQSFDCSDPTLCAVVMVRALEHFDESHDSECDDRELGQVKQTGVALH